jgi:SAM-dependent methyltransferase
VAEKVGNTGSVTATDIAPKIDLDPRLPWLEARRHNILEPGLVDSRYDLVHCRLLLIHVSPVEVALRNMVRALRPGGWLIIEEPGDLKVSTVGEDDPRVAEYNRTYILFRVCAAVAPVLARPFGGGSNRGGFAFRAGMRFFRFCGLLSMEVAADRWPR